MAAGDLTNHVITGDNKTRIEIATVELAATETTATTFTSTLTDILNVQVTAKALDLGNVIGSASGSTVTIDCESAHTGTNYVDVVVRGY